MIIKMAFVLPAIALAKGALAGITIHNAGKAARRVANSFDPSHVLSEPINSMIGANIHDIGHFTFSKSNKFGRFFQKSTLADMTIAAKRATEGKVFANRSPAGLLMYGIEPMKAMAVNEANLATHALPKIVTQGYKVGNIKIGGGMFDGNRLNVDYIKNKLEHADKLDRTAFGLQVAVPALSMKKEYDNQKLKGEDTKTAIKSSLKSGLTTAALTSVPIGFVRAVALNPAAKAHRALSRDSGYGYELLRDASREAEKSLNRPSIINYSKHMYKTPEQNAKGILGKVYGDTLKTAFGQKTMKGHSKETGYYYDKNEVASDAPFDWAVKKTKRVVTKLDNVLSGNLGK
jgi:hypothetical protein